MKANVKWAGGSLFLGQSNSEHSVVMDSSGKVSSSPLENMLMSLAGCSSVDVVSILEKARQNVRGVEVQVDSERVETIPRRFSKIHLHFVITGTNVEEKHVKRAIELSADKYCSIALMIREMVEVTHDYEIVEA